MTDVFISYAREDRPFVQRLHDALAYEGRHSWVDWEALSRYIPYIPPRHRHRSDRSSN